MDDYRDENLRFLAGMPVEINNGYLSSPKVKDIIRLGESKYNFYISHLLIDKDNLEIEDKSDISNFDIAFLNCYHSEEFKDVFFSALKLMFNDVPILGSNDEELFFYFGDEIDNWKITKDNFPTIQELVKIATNTQLQNDDYNPGNEKAEKFIERLKAIKASRPKPKEKMNLFSIIRGLSWRSNDMNAIDIFDLTIYQLYQAFFATEKIDNYRSTIQGVYAGTIDGKKIDFSNIHWANLDIK